MAIPSEHAARYVYHFTHLHNLKDVLTHGFLCCNEQKRLGLRHTSIAENSIQERRAKMDVTCGPQGVVHDYVPLYFGKTSPMLLMQVKAKNVDQEMIIYFVFSIKLVERDDVVFTDAAANALAPPNFFSDPADLSKLNWAAVDYRKWGSPDNSKPARMAELLVHRSLDPRSAAYVVVWNSAVADEVKKVYAECKVAPPTIRFQDYYDPGYYFTNFRKGLPADMLNQSISSGPIYTKGAYEASLNFVLANRGKNAAARFSTVYDLLAALRANFAALPETAELVGLETSNEAHKENVGDHTLRVVQQARSLFSSISLTQSEQALVELAAYLHDIGKGPKSRWVGCGGKQEVDPDHPIKSTEMLQRILTAEVKTVTDDEARILCKLVCYHDLYGHVVSDDVRRHREQVVEIADNDRDLEMLIAIGRADMSAIKDSWSWVAAQQASELRNWVLQQMKGG